MKDMRHASLRLICLLISFLMLLPLLVGCGLMGEKPEKPVFSFHEPTGGEDAAPMTPAQSSAPSEPAPQASDSKSPDTGGETAGRLAMPLPQQALPAFAREIEEDANVEPAVPMSQPSSDAIRGIAGHKVERFLKTLATTPLYYQYALYPGEGSEEEPAEVLIALSRDGSYMRIDRLDGSRAVLQNNDSFHYEIDNDEKTYKIVSGPSAYNDELSIEAFRELEASAGNLVNTGRGDAVFMGRKVRFEEFTLDGKRYVRYYFIGDVCVGHRSFEDGKIVDTIEILEASNRYDENLFILHESLTQVKNDLAPEEELSDETETESST